MQRQLLASFVVLASVAAAFELNPSWIGIAGRNNRAGEFMWRPSRPVNFDGHESVAVMASMGPAECTEETAFLAEIGAEKGDLIERCPPIVLFTGDGGQTFERARGLSPHFCGNVGALRDNKLYCPGARAKVSKQMVKSAQAHLKEVDEAVTKQGRTAVPRPQQDDPIVAFEEHEFQVVATADTEEQKVERRRKYIEGAEDTHTANGVLTERKSGNHITFDQSVFDSEIASLRFGGGVVNVPERKIIVRNLEVRLDNGTRIHATYKSNDGSHWDYVSTIPVPFSRHTQILRLSDTRIMLASGPIGSMNQTTSLFLGNKWERVEASGFVMPGNNHVSRYFTTVTSGIVPRPKVGIVALGTKKNSTRSILLSQLHNDVRDQAAEQSSLDLLNYTNEFLGAPVFDCVGEGAGATDSAGCASSGFVAVVPADVNGTLLVFYDQLRGDRGFAAPSRKGEHVIYAMRLRVNETDEQTEYEARVAREIAQKEAEQEQVEAAQRQREEIRKRKEKEKIEQRKRSKARRQQWLRDDERNKQTARDFEAQDGQFIVIRDVVDDTIDLEREMF